MTRVFSAVDIENDKLLDELCEVRDLFDLGFNPVGRRKMHVTLEFFEDISWEEVDRIKSCMEGINVSPFSVNVEGVGSFPSHDYIRVIWAGFRKERKLREIYSNVQNHGVSSDNNHDFKPHVTLLRVDDISYKKKKKLQKQLKEFSSHDFGVLKVDSLKLFESDLESDDYNLIFKKEL